MDLLLLRYLLCLPLLSLRRVGSDDDVGQGQIRLPKKDSTTKACLLLDHTYPMVYKIALSFYGYYMHAILILVASVSIDTLP